MTVESKPNLNLICPAAEYGPSVQRPLVPKSSEYPAF
jgi:hypothetical protein